MDLCFAATPPIFAIFVEKENFIMTSIIWNDKYNEDYTGEVTVSPSSGNGNAQVSISGSPNEGLDRSGTITASGSGISREMSVVNEGRRHVFMTSDGLPFRTSDGSTYNTIKKTDIGVRGVIGLYSAKDLTNKRMAANPLWRDKSGLENHLQMKNFLWKLGSGCGSYKLDFTTFTPNGGELSRTSSSFTYSVKENDNATIYNPLVDVGYVYDFNVRIEGLSAGVTASFLILGSDSVVFEKDGIYNIHLEVKEEATQKRLYFKIIRSSSSINATVKVTQIPDYSGAIVFDGVDDYGICETFPILTKEKGYTVMALRKWLDSDIEGYLCSNAPDGSNLGAFVFEKNSSTKPVTYNFGTPPSNIVIDYNSPVTYQTSTKYNSSNINVGSISEGTDVLLVGSNYKKGATLFSNFALYSLVIIDHDATEEERQLVIDYWKKEFPELFTNPQK